MSPSLCLGSAQFGLAYGITNNVGKVSSLEVKNIIEKAYFSGVKFIDTAVSYGESEEIIGNNINNKSQFKIISKFPSQNKKYFSDKDSINWEKCFIQSLSKLKIEKIDSYLVHNPLDLKRPGSKYLIKWLLSIKKRGLVKRLGVSIYNSFDLEGIDENLLNIVQLPLSLYDQRFIKDGTISKLKSIGCAVHARSIYLQGLLLLNTNKWPKWIRQDSINHHNKLEILAEHKQCNLIDLCISFIKEQTEIEAAVIGICTAKELNQLIASWENNVVWNYNEWVDWACEDDILIDPRKWRKK